jgi:tetratricopeptide (TPR) repeat protein
MPAYPPKPKSADDRNLVPVDENYVAPGLEDHLRLLWQNHSRRIILVTAVVLLLLLGNAGRNYLAARHADEVAEAYATATTEAALTAFIAAHPDEPQAGLAQLRLADAAYAAGNFPTAHVTYGQAVTRLASHPAGAALAARARLGAAVATLLAGQTAEGEAALKQLASDTALPKAVRAEAAFTAAVHAAGTGRSAEASQFAEQAEKIDPEGPWKSRAQALPAILSAPPPAPPASLVVPPATMVPAPAVSASPSPAAPPASGLLPPPPLPK